MIKLPEPMKESEIFGEVSYTVLCALVTFENSNSGKGRCFKKTFKNVPR